MDTVNRECIEIQKDIKRLGMEKDGHFCVDFGTLFDDDKVQQYYEALVGTLKAAKKRGIISFQSPMLLKGKSGLPCKEMAFFELLNLISGVHDKEEIVLLKETDE